MGISRGLYDIVNLQAFAKKVADRITKETILLLNGDLGVGKTTFTKLLIKNLNGNEKEVSSPSFNIMHIYNTLHFDVYHCDFFRIKNVEELYELGLEEIIGSYPVIIEWPDLIKDTLPSKNCFFIDFCYTDNRKERKIFTNFPV